MKVSLAKIMRPWLIPTVFLFLTANAEADTLRFHCVYSSYNDAGGNGAQDAKGFNLEFALDTVSKKAVMIGNVGVEDVLVHPGSDGTTFLEFLPTGAVQSTTITPLGESVHSRHTIIKGKMAATQYYGTCS
jgi:hypothetical protein